MLKFSAIQECLNFVKGFLKTLPSGVVSQALENWPKPCHLTSGSSCSCMIKGLALLPSFMEAQAARSIAPVIDKTTRYRLRLIFSILYINNG